MISEKGVRQPLTLPTGVGLCVALGLPYLTFLAAESYFGAEQSFARVIAGLVIHWMTFAAMLAIVLGWEAQSLGSIGLKAVRWWTIPAGLVAGVAITFVSGALVTALHLSSDAQYAAYLQSMPFIVRVLLAITAGVFEETLYRGYALERLTSLWGNKWLAALATVMFFTLAHVPAVGFAHLLPVGIVSVFVTLLYVWRRDLLLNIVAHATIDAVGLLLAPLAGH